MRQAEAGAEQNQPEKAADVQLRFGGDDVSRERPRDVIH